MKAKKPPVYIDIDITRLNKKGNGLGFDADKQIEVPFAIPGDKVKASILKKRRQKVKAKLEEVLAPSEDRIEPVCKHFGICGGCRLQQMNMEAQLKSKTESIRKYFGDLLTEQVKEYPIVPSVKQYAYRNKMEYSFNTNAAGEKFLGFTMEGGRFVLNLEECHLVSPWFTECLTSVRNWWKNSQVESFHIYKNTGSLRTLTLRESARTGDRMAMLTVSGNPDYALTKQDLNGFVEAVKQAAEQPNTDSQLCIVLRIQQCIEGSATNFYEMILSGPDVIREELHVKAHPDKEPEVLRFHISPMSFFQPNPLQAERLYSHVLQIANLDPTDIVYDLYCGTGTIGLCCAHLAKEVMGIEISPEAVLDAKTNARLNNLENVTFHSGAVRNLLSYAHKGRNNQSPDVLIVDPPRAGFDPVALKEISGLNAKKIVYVSCNPETQANDVRFLVEHGYKLSAIQPVDMFPQTYHVENIALLVRV